DQVIGRVLVQLRTMDAFDNTLIFFLSDNGSSAEIMVRTDGHDPNAPPGSGPSYLCLGPGWSTVCNTPFRRHKTWVHEGGCATPLIAHWPKGIKGSGELRRDPAHVIDVVPTILELAGVKRSPADAPKAPGHSLLPAFAKDGSLRREYLWWLHEGNRAIRVGDWKLVAAKGDPWELYNLREDRTETNNLASNNPGKVKELEHAWTERMDEFRKLASQNTKP
ncbi:MAG: sulfatase-like hydrolase/transferase, partial [Roseibacillus sp.]|nr:sulfatase-like hydrolase/transferase [Roseibacillus sp.]